MKLMNVYVKPYKRIYRDWFHTEGYTVISNEVNGSLY
jgi:hypothetical protein